jgi:hypothetical protein
MKKMFWCVVSEYDGTSKVKARIIGRYLEEKPQDTSREMARTHICEDWFSTFEAARVYLDGVKAA